MPSSKHLLYDALLSFIGQSRERMAVPFLITMFNRNLPLTLTCICTVACSSLSRSSCTRQLLSKLNLLTNWQCEGQDPRQGGHSSRPAQCLIFAGKKLKYSCTLYSTYPTTLRFITMQISRGWWNMDPRYRVGGGREGPLGGRNIFCDLL